MGPYLWKKPLKFLQQYIDKNKLGHYHCSNQPNNQSSLDNREEV